MANVARRHHYLPVSYLAGFTEEGTRDSFLHVFDLAKKERRRQRPEKVAFVKDLHGIDMVGIPKDSFENALAGFDGMAAKAIAGVVASQSFTEDQLGDILHFVALTMVRVPEVRNALITEIENRSGMPFDRAIAEPDEWAVVVKWFVDAKMGWTREEVERLCSKARRSRAKAQIWNFFNMCVLQDRLLRLLTERYWNVLIAGDGTANFICSDNPVGTFHSPSRPVYERAFLTDSDAVVCFPLSRRVALVGHLEQRNLMPEVPDGIVAVINFQTLAGANRYLFAAQQDFISVGENGSLSGASDLLALI